MVGVQCRGPRGFIYCVLLSMWATGDQQQIPSNIRDVKAYPETERERERGEGTGDPQKRAGRQTGGEKAGRVERGEGTDLILKEQKPLLIRPQMTSSHCIAKGGGEEEDDQREAKEEWTQGQKERKKVKEKGHVVFFSFSSSSFVFFCFSFLLHRNQQPTANNNNNNPQHKRRRQQRTARKQEPGREREWAGFRPRKKEQKDRREKEIQKVEGWLLRGLGGLLIVGHVPLHDGHAGSKETGEGALVQCPAFQPSLGRYRRPARLVV